MTRFFVEINKDSSNTKIKLNNRVGIMPVDDIGLFAPSAKGLQKRLDLSHTYGCNHDIEFNLSKSSCHVH